MPAIFFDPSGSLDTATEPVDMPDSGLTRAKNVRVDLDGLVKQRSGHSKIYTGAPTDISLIAEQDETIYTFGSTVTGNTANLPLSQANSGIYYPEISADDGWALYNGTTGIFNYEDTAKIGIEDILGFVYYFDFFVCFRNVTIPPGVGITSAFIRFTAYLNDSGNLDALLFLASDVNPSPPTTYAQYDGLSLTSGVAWNSIEDWVQGQQHDTPDFAPQLQTIVDDLQWKSGNNVLVIMKQNGGDAVVTRYYQTIDMEAGNVAELHVAWS